MKFYIDVDSSNSSHTTYETLTNAEKKMRKPLNASKADMLQAWYTDPKDTPGKWTVNIPGINEDNLVDGLTIRIRLSTSYYNNGQGYNTLNVNGLGPKLVYYRYNSFLTSHVPQWAEILLTYRATRTVVSAIDGSSNTINGCRPSAYTPTAGHYNGTNLGTDGWVLDAAYSDGNNYERLNNTYERRYVNATYDLQEYTLCMLDKDGRLHSIVTTGGNGTAKTADTTPFRPDRIIYYSRNGDWTKNTAMDSNVLYEDIPITTVAYSINSALDTYSDLYLVGSINADGYFVLDGSSTTSYYKTVDTKVAAVPANTFVKGKYYLYVGASTTATNYMQLLPSHQLFFCNDTNGQKLTAVAPLAAALINPKVNKYVATQTAGTEIGKITLDSVESTLYYGKPEAFVWTNNNSGQLILNLSMTDSSSIASPVVPAADATHNGVLTHTAQTIAGVKTFNDIVKLKASQYTDAAGTGSLDLQNSDIYGVNSIKFADACDTAAEGLQWYRDTTHVDSLWDKTGVLYYTPNRAWGGTATNYTILHTGNLDPTWVSWTAGTTNGPTGKATFGGATTTATTLNIGAIPVATKTASGVVSTTTQTVAGNKYTTGPHMGLVSGGETDKFFDFAYGADPTAETAPGASWRIGALNSGSSDTNYFVIQTGGSSTSATEWKNAFRIGMNTLDIAVGGNLYSLATTNTKTLGTSTARWKAVYIGTADSYGSAYVPIYWNGGVPTACSSPSALINLASDNADTLFKASPQPGVTGTLPVKHGGTGVASWTTNALVMTGANATDALTTRAITNNTSNTAVANNTNIPTMNTIYYGLALINNAAQYRGVSIYAPTSAGTANYLLTSSGGTAAPVWVSRANVEVGSATQAGSATKFTTKRYIGIGGHATSTFTFNDANVTTNPNAAGQTIRLYDGTTSEGWKWYQIGALGGWDKEISTAKSLRLDPYFKEGTNGCTYYNNNGANGNLTLTRIPAIDGTPTNSGYILEITVTGACNPNWGGFHQTFTSRANAHFIHKFIAKIPVGYTIGLHNNQLGDSPKIRWLTNNVGTGEWETYVCEWVCGATGSFSSGGYFALSGSPTPTADAPLKWYVAACWTFDLGAVQYPVYAESWTAGGSNSATPVYLENGILKKCGFSFGASINASGNANRLAWYSTVNTISSGDNLYSDGSVLAVNKNNITSGYQFEVAGKAILGSTTAANGTNTHIVNGHIVINAAKDINNSYSEGIRMNLGSNGWSTIAMGGADGTTTGTGNGIWLVGVNNKNFYISHNGSNSATTRIQGQSTGFRVYPKLAVNADINSNYVAYFNGATAANGKLYGLNTDATTTVGTGSCIISGGLSAAKSSAIGGTLVVNGTTAITSGFTFELKSGSARIATALVVNRTSNTTFKLIAGADNTQTEYTPTLNVNGKSLLNGTVAIPANQRAIEFRPDYATYNSYVYYGTAGNEALNFVNKQAVTSFIFWTGNRVERSDNWYLSDTRNADDTAWVARTDNPALQIKQNSVYINKLLPSGTNAAYTLYVNGKTNITGVTTLTDNTNATNVGTGALQVSGGVSVAKDIVAIGKVVLGYATQSTAPSGSGIKVHDTRSVNHLPNTFGDQTVQFYFNEGLTDSGRDSRWSAIMHIKGWTGDYAAHELSFNAHADVVNRNLYHRTGSQNTWQPWRMILDTGNIDDAASPFALTTWTCDGGSATGHKPQIILTKEWVDTGIQGADLPVNGSYIVQVYVNSGGTSGGPLQYQEYYTGVMSWFRDDTNSTDPDEIWLHKAGHASNANNIYLRTIRTSTNSGGLKLQISADLDCTAATTIVFKFRKMI